MSKSKNPVVGHVACPMRNCRHNVTVHQTKRGGANRRGLLYVNCPQHKCVQPPDEETQKYFRQNMVSESGYEYLTEEKEEPELTEATTEEEPEEEPETTGEELEPETAVKPTKWGAIGLLGLAVAGILAAAR